jgi:hypothetical protein
MNNATRASVANWKFYAKRTIEEEEVWFREGWRGGEEKGLNRFSV